MRGVNVAAIVLSVGALTFSIIVGVPHIEQVKKATADAKERQKEVTAFQEGMKDELDKLIKDVGLDKTGSYDDLSKMAET